MRVKAVCPIHGENCTCQYDISIDLVIEEGRNTNTFRISGTCDQCAGRGVTSKCKFKEVP